jgi:hypothetical protein
MYMLQEGGVAYEQEEWIHDFARLFHDVTGLDPAA